MSGFIAHTALLGTVCGAINNIFYQEPLAGTEMRSPFTEKIRQMLSITNLSTSSASQAIVMKELKKPVSFN